MCPNPEEPVALLESCVLWLGALTSHTTLLVSLVYKMPAVRGPQNNSAKLTAAGLPSASVHSQCPGGRGGLTGSSNPQPRSVARVFPCDWSRASLQGGGADGCPLCS